MASKFLDFRAPIANSMAELCRASQFFLRSSTPHVELTSILKPELQGVDISENATIAWMGEGAGFAAAIPGVSQPELKITPSVDGSPSGCADVMLELPASNGMLVARFSFRGVAPADVSAHLRDGLLALGRSFARQIELLHMASAAVAAEMLRIAYLLDDGQSRALSHELSGLLHLVAGMDASQVEVTAMQIAGIVEVDGLVAPPRSVRLTQSGTRLVSSFGHVNGLSGAVSATAPSHVLAPASDDEQSLSIFARLSLLGDAFDVAETSDGKLCFRPSNTSGNWCWLQSQLSDGWTTVGAEILSRSRDIVEAWGRMHVMKLPDQSQVSDGQLYSLEGQTWVISDSTGGLKARLSDRDVWVAVPVIENQSRPQQAMAALLQLDPTFKERMLPAAQEWAERMALSAQVAPIMGAAA